MIKLLNYSSLSEQFSAEVVFVITTSLPPGVGVCFSTQPLLAIGLAQRNLPFENDPGRTENHFAFLSTRFRYFSVKPSPDSKTGNT